MANVFNLTKTDYTDGSDYSLRPGRDYKPFVLYLPGDRTTYTYTGTVSNALSFGSQTLVALFDISLAFGTYEVCGVNGEYTQLTVTMDDAVTDTVTPLPLRKNINTTPVIGTNVYYYDIKEDNAGDIAQIIEGYLESIDVVG